MLRLQTIPTSDVKENALFHALFLGIYSTSITAAYLYFKLPLIFHLSFISITLISVILPWYHFVHISKMSKQNALTIDKVRFVFLLSTLSYVFGFTLWNIEKLLCNELRSVRAAIGYPFRVLLELHGYWHLFASLATYGQIVTCQYAHYLASKRDDVDIVYYCYIPVIIAKNKSKTS
jgi:dihydroceramidase